MVELRFNTLVVYALVLFFCSTATDHGAHSLTGPHIADVNILLPPKMTHPVEYHLLGSGGCFKWSWDHHDVLSVVPEYNESNHCSTSARLRSIAPYAGRKETCVYATDLRSGVVVRCKVYIDMFTRIQIFHSSVKLDLDGLATLRIRAFDSEENVFSSLVGLRFMWQLMPESNGSRHHLVHVPLRDSPLSDCSGFCGDLEVQTKLEDSDVFSDLLVVKGIEIGHEVVSVHLLEPHFGNMTDNIVLTVAEAMSLDPPSPVLVLAGAAVQYSLRVIRANVPHVLRLPSPFHRWSASNSSIAQVDTMMGMVHALDLGETSIIVEDTRVVGHVQVSSLNVVLPDYVALYLLPLSKFGGPVDGLEPTMSNARWYVVSGRQYLIELKVFSRGPSARVIFISENEDVKLDYDQPDHWTTAPVPDSAAVKYGWQNSRLLEPTSQGLAKLSASLTYFNRHIETTEVLKVVQEVMVCDQVKIIKKGRNISWSNIVLPWSPDVYQEAELTAVGGCANTPNEYRWLSSDSSILSISAMGVLQTKRPGQSIVKVVSIYDSLNFDTIFVEVAIPSSVVMLPNFPVETVVGSYIQAAVAMKTSNGDYFYQCDAFQSSIKWFTGSDSFLIVNSTSKASHKSELKNEPSISDYHPACAWTYLYAASSGQAILQATFSKHMDDGFSMQIMLKASAPIASFSPFSVYQAGDGNKFGGYWCDFKIDEINSGLESSNALYLSPGGLLDVILVGGPKRWGKGVEFIQTIDILDEKSAHSKDGALIHLLPNAEGNGYRISCQELGNFTLVFRRGNLVGDDHPQPVVAEARLLLECSFPSSIVVLADEPVNKLDAIQNALQADRDAGHVRSTPVTVANGRSIRLSAVGISNSGKAFANSSSVSLRWELKNCEELASWDEAYNYKFCTSAWERYLTLKNASGQCTVRAVVQNTLNKHDSSLSENALTDAVPLQVVASLQLFPEFSLLFFKPDTKMNLSVVGGSCYLKAVVSDSQVVEVIQPFQGLQCSQLTLVPRGVGTAIVTVDDIGLSPPLSAASLVKVADVEWLKIMSGEGISLMEGTTYSVDLLAGTHDGDTFDYSQYSYMSIEVHVGDQIVGVVDNHNLSAPSDKYISASSFTIYGKYAGVTTLYVTAKQQSGQEIYSQTIKVEVYIPPVVHPGDIFLLPGASYVLTVKGGPRVGAFVEYTSLNDSTVAVQETFGRLSAISPGNATIVATFYGNRRTVLCQAHGKVRVEIPSAAILNIQSEKLAVGHEMPIFPYLIEGDMFSFYELCKNFEWTIGNEKVLSFLSAEDIKGSKYQGTLPGQSGYEGDQDVQFIKVLYGRSGGSSNVALTFSCDFSTPGSFSHSKSYSASLYVRVVADPPLALGIPSTWILPPHYTTSDVLPADYRLDDKGDRKSQAGNVEYSLLRHCGKKDNELQKGVISIYGNKVKTTDSEALACIQAKDHSTGRIEVASCVRVAEVAQIRFLRKSPAHVINLAVGSEIELPIQYYDNLGNPFLEAHDVVSFEIETNYQDILTLDIVSRRNGNTFVKAMRHGRALVVVRFVGNTRKSDYLMISVGAHIHPQNPVLHLGSYMNFSVEGLIDQASGQWLSANGSVISVDSSSGRAATVGEGTALVTFQSSSLKLQTTVTVLNWETIDVDVPRGTLTNVLPHPGHYNFSVKYSTQKFGAPNRNVEAPYDCEVEPTFVGYANPWRDLDTGDSYCLFFPYSPEHLERSIPKRDDRSPDISISIHAKLREANDVSGSSTAFFIGGFSIMDMDKDALQLNLTPESNQSIITLVGNTDVGIHWSNRDLLTVRNLLKRGSGIGGQAQYEVKVLKPRSFKEKLIFSLPANGQRVELDINFDASDKEAITAGETPWAMLLWTLTLLILSMAAFKHCMGRPNRSRLSVTPSSPDATAPQTPDRNNPALSNEQSPRSPQPFIEYVRRTIDETPYYRREGRRRFDQQNTY